jgi:hypothetical protein
MSNNLQRDLCQETKLQRLSVLVFIVAIATIVAMTYVQTALVPGLVEGAVRTGAYLAGLIAVPILVILGFRSWYQMSKATMSAWRNGLALSSMVLPSLVWVGFISMNVESLAINHFPHVVDDLATLLNSNLLAGLLAIALTRKARLIIWSSVLLLWAGLESGIHF